MWSERRRKEPEEELEEGEKEGHEERESLAASVVYH